MKQFTSNEQTAKLIELGFERPFRNEYLYIVEEYGYAVNKERNYSIGELIKMLPTAYDSEGLSIGYHYMADVWIVRYPTKILIHKEELVDALYAMVVKLKEEGVI